MTRARLSAVLLAAAVAGLVYFTLGPEALGPLFLGLLFGTIGVVLTRIGVSGLFEYDRQQAQAARAEGVVTEIRFDERPGDQTYEYPVVHFTTPEGVGVDFEATIRQHPPKYKVGDRVAVTYEAGDPQRADIAGTEWIGILAILGFGLLGLFAGLVLLSVFVQRVGRPSSGAP
jgi:hypothetical protein